MLNSARVRKIRHKHRTKEFGILVSNFKPSLKWRGRTIGMSVWNNASMNALRGTVKLFRFLIILTMITGCKSPGLLEITKNYDTLSGKLVAEPALESENERLFIYLKVSSEVEGKENNIAVCVASNGEVKSILSELRGLLLNAINEPVFLYVKKSDGTYKEIIGGIDYEVFAVGVYIPSAKKYRYVLTGYGEGLRAAMDDVSWSGFIQKVLKAGLEKAL